MKERDLSPFIEFAKNNKDWKFIIMGRIHHKQYYKSLDIDNETTIYIGELPAPLHLYVTMKATVGIVTYDTETLNAIFCAPNKVWEYNAYGVPIIAKSNPVLYNIVDRYKNGAIFNTNDSKDVSAAIDRIMADYPQCRQNSIDYYKSYHYLDEVRKIFGAYIQPS